jgi:sarcosine oxidase subunit beta
MPVDVVVIGGGIVGLACANELASAGATVTVLEADVAVARGSTARANGGVRAQFATPPNIAFSVHAIRAYEELGRRRPEIAFHQTGYLLMTGTLPGERGLRDAMAHQWAHGLDVRWLEPADVSILAPMVRTVGLRGATFHGRDGFLDPAGAAAAIAADARDAGATIVTGAAVTSLDRDGDRWRVSHAAGATTSAVVVNAAGADARAVARLAGGVDLPVEPVRRNLALFMDDPAPPTPMLVDLDTGVLVRREIAGGWVAAYSDPDDPPGRDTSLDPRFLGQLGEHVPHRFPFLEDLPVDPGRCWAGLYPATPDHHAIVGVDPRAPGLLHAAGFGGHGVMHAPAAGRAIAELAATGRCETFDLRPLRPARFAEDDLVVEANVF